MRKLISIIVPVYNEEANVRNLYNRVNAALESVADRYDWEFVFTDNHSEDKTFDILEDLAAKDERIRAFRFSRNFGFQRSILTGYRLAHGDAAVQIDCDLQDPPEMIAEFLNFWERGHAVVYGVRRHRQENFILNGARRIFYKLIDALSDDHLPHDAGDFRLVDRRILDLLNEIDDQEPYLRGFVAGAGFDQIGIEYDRDVRTAGQSKFGFGELVKLALDGITQHSTVPLRAFTYLGMMVSFGAVGYACFAIGAWLFDVSSELPRGWSSLAVGVFFLGGIQLIGVGILGEYVGRTYKQVKKRPISVIEKSIDPSKPRASSKTK